MAGDGKDRKDPAWKYGKEAQTPAAEKGYKYVVCNFCDKVVRGGITRLKEHLGQTHKNVSACPAVPVEVKNEMLGLLKETEQVKHANQMRMDEMIEDISYYGGGSAQKSSRGVRGPMDRFMMDKGDDEDDQMPADTKMTAAKAKEERNNVCKDIGRFFFENGIEFNCARSASFINMVRSIGHFGRGLKPPTMYELRTWILKEEEKTTETYVDEIKETWKKTGVSLISDGWSDMRNRSLINFLINNQHGTLFMKTVDASSYIKDADKLAELLDEVIEEVREDIVVQVVTDNAAAYKAAGGKLMAKRKKLYWTPCAAHCIDLMLEKIGELPQHKNALLKAKKVSNFIHNHQWVLSKFRELAKKNLIRPAATRFATAFLTLESMLELKQPLESFFFLFPKIG